MSSNCPHSFSRGIGLLFLLLAAGCDGFEAQSLFHPDNDQPVATRASEGPLLDQPGFNLGLGEPSPLPLPGSLTVNDYEQELFQFLKERKYVDLGWRRDKTVRDTGPFLNGIYYGTHPAVRVYYSPGIIRWLANGRIGKIPDGEMIIKEQYEPPAARHKGKTEAQLRESLKSWTVMVKDKSGSHDGWFWSNPGADPKPHDYHAKNEEPTSGFGMYCIRCHASTQSPGIHGPDDPQNEFLFASLRNIEGFPGQPILFRVDESWRNPPNADAESKEESPASIAAEAAKQPDQEFLALYDAIAPTDLSEDDSLPPTSYDSVPLGKENCDFATSNQCMNCHAGLTGPLGPVGFVHTTEDKGYGDPGLNVSPYGEWRWTPMGLAGRDPVFHAQLESELALIRNEFGSDGKAVELSETLVDTCLRCHAAMGHRHIHQSQNENASHSLDDLHAKTDLGALSREGVTCMICHRLQPPPQDPDDTTPYLEHFLQTATTGNLHFGPPNEIYGPYKNEEVSSYAMHHASGKKPVYSDYIKQSNLCGTCHTVSLPTIDHPLGEEKITPEEAKLLAAESVPLFRSFHHHVEQATYLEWLNSSFNNETNPANPQGRSCQDCHMSDQTYADEVGALAGPVTTKIAAIHDDSYPDAENLVNHDQLNIRRREKYRRHNFAGLNAWLIEFFKQEADLLGIKKTDYMTGSNNGANQSLANIHRTARSRTATIKVNAKPIVFGDRAMIEAAVEVTNLAGHRFPTGVAFRRAFIEFSVMEKAEDGNERLLWSSGRTNAQGVIVDRENEPLPTEFFDEVGGAEAYQPHHRMIESEDQVQIYETLVRDSRGKITTSFVRGCETLKDNRLLPQGWTTEGPGGGLGGAYLKATHPNPATATDSDFAAGRDVTLYRIALPPEMRNRELTVKATLYYQALPPYYLQNLFETAPLGTATKRLHAMASHLDLSQSPIQDWKLEIASDSVNLHP